MRLAMGIVAAAVLAVAVAAQGPTGRRSFTPARLWDGKTPDFRGIWQVRDTAYVNIEGHPAEKGVAAAKSIENQDRLVCWGRSSSAPSRT